MPLGKTTFQITTSVGRSLQTYDLRRGLNLVFLSSPLCPETITATRAYRDRVFVAWGSDEPKASNGVWVFKRGRLQAELEQSPSARTIKELLILGSWILGRADKYIEVWKNETYEHYTSIPLSSSATEFTTFCALPTFVNKICVGRADGAIDIYNVSTGRLVHTIASPSSSAAGITCLRAVPTIGLLAVARANGALHIVDVETEEIVIDFPRSNDGKAITCITFRTDGQGAGEDGRSDGVMATASIESGDLQLWDLNRGGRMAGTLRAAHEISSSSKASGISSVEFLAGQPVIVSTGLDNALKSWVFDAVPFSPTPRILHSRSGHAAPISCLEFLPAATDGSEANGKWLLSAGNDRSLWGFSLRRDGQSTELSQGNVRHKAKKTGKILTDESNIEDFKCPPITSVACSLNRDGGMGAIGGAIWTNSSSASAEESNMTGWESVVTAHYNDKFARTWSWGRKRAGRWAFESGDHEPVTSVAITACGTFALVGSAGGSLDMFNLQSGQHRQRFPAKLKPVQAKTVLDSGVSHKGHSDEITGIVVDNTNRTVVSTSLDGQIIFWQFLTGRIQHRVKLEASPTAINHNPVSGLMSIACDDLCIRIVDIETKNIVRELWGCIGQIYDHCFSHDGRWVVACSMDSVVRVFDLATGHLVDAFRTETCTNVAFSSTGEFLATAHAGQIGINIWNNKSLMMQVSSTQINEDQDIIDLSNLTDFEATNQLAEIGDINEVVDNRLEVERTIEQLDRSLLTLSLQPQSRWQTLLNLENIRKRNKPIEPPKKPKAAPFFLGSSLTNGVKEQPLTPDEDKNEDTEAQRSRIARLSSLQPVQSVVTTHLETFDETNQPDELIRYLSGLSPSAADLEIRSLTMQEMPLFVHALTVHLQQRRDFELINTWMSVFLKLHGEFIGGIEDIRTAVVAFQTAMHEEEARLSQSVGWARGVIEYLRSSR